MDRGSMHQSGASCATDGGPVLVTYANIDQQMSIRWRMDKVIRAHTVSQYTDISCSLSGALPPPRVSLLSQEGLVLSVA